VIDRLAGCPPTPSKPPAVSTAAQSVAPAAATNIRRRHTGSPGRSAEPRAGAYSAPVGAQRAGACIALGQCTIPPFWCVMSPKCVLVVHFLYHSSLQLLFLGHFLCFCTTAVHKRLLATTSLECDTGIFGWCGCCAPVAHRWQHTMLLAAGGIRARRHSLCSGEGSRY
jgi:hypothetical protein